MSEFKVYFEGVTETQALNLLNLMLERTKSERDVLGIAEPVERVVCHEREREILIWLNEMAITICRHGLPCLNDNTEEGAGMSEYSCLAKCNCCGQEATSFLPLDFTNGNPFTCENCLRERRAGGDFMTYSNEDIARAAGYDWPWLINTKKVRGGHAPDWPTDPGMCVEWLLPVLERRWPELITGRINGRYSIWKDEQDMENRRLAPAYSTWHSAVIAAIMATREGTP